MIVRSVSSALALLVTLLLLLLLATPRAQAAEQIKALKDRAHAAFDRGDYDGALRAFEQALAQTRDERLRYNVGLSLYKRYQRHQRAADLARARAAFQRFLDRAKPERYSEGREVLRKARGFARDHLDNIERELRRTSAPSPPPKAATPAPAPRDSPRASRLHWWLYGGAAALAIAGAVTGGLALAAESDARELGEGGDATAANARADRADNLAIATDVLLVGAGVSAAAGLILHLLRGSGSGSSEARVSVGATTVALTLSF